MRAEIDRDTTKAFFTPFSQATFDEGLYLRHAQISGFIDKYAPCLKRPGLRKWQSPFAVETTYEARLSIRPLMFINRNAQPFAKCSIKIRMRLPVTIA